jgi:hypothetical protein
MAELGPLQVYQVISAYTSRLDNVVEFYFKYGLPELPGLGVRQDPIVATLSLRHTFEAPGGPTVRITFEDTEVTASGTSFNGTIPRLFTVRSLFQGYLVFPQCSKTIHSSLTALFPYYSKAGHFSLTIPRLFSIPSPFQGFNEG